MDFQLETDCPGRLAVPGSRNLRDLGGYRTSVSGDPRWVRRGRLYRSGHFGNLTVEGCQALSDLRIATVIDFRIAVERGKHANRFHPDHRPRVVEIPINPGSSRGFSRSITNKGGAHGALVLVMEEMNRRLVRDHAAAFRRMFEALCDGEGPHVLHCASGKDRTGAAAALVLAVLGVDRETITEDFLLTNAALDLEREVANALKDFGWAGGLDESTSALRPILEVRASYLLAAFDEIDQKLGGMARYQREALGLDARAIARLRELYLTNEAG